MNRRGLLVAGGLGILGAAGSGVGLVEANVLPGKVPLDRALGRCGDAPPVPAARATVRQETFRSAARGRDVRLVIATPRATAAGPLPVVIALHGWGGDARSVLTQALDRHLAQAHAQGIPPFAVVGVDGGEMYWHPRASGDDPHRMITAEVLPRLRREGLRTDRIGVMGWSMGGYGALLLGQSLGPSRVGAIVASSPAVFTSYDDARATNTRAFDDADDFARHDVRAALGRLRGIPTWVDCGRSDPFTGTARRLRAGLGNPAGGLFGGCHDNTYWQRRAPAQLTFLGRELG
ncbi:alpha/beta hydrolase [Actinomadura alba]|uniref:Alpha/beta fold hydrolase n=1 Tax=Actinomadura alba TaxID=406431 RepID=A0ABR7LW24_9ACTN|nr:alpha/beta fold hydrolase [Actinomadura alba]MBC6468984.1 alpha/beta fold hydrolase [Actinomadura alba]